MIWSSFDSDIIAVRSLAEESVLARNWLVGNIVPLESTPPPQQKPAPIERPSSSLSVVSLDKSIEALGAEKWVHRYHVCRDKSRAVSASTGLTLDEVTAIMLLLSTWGRDSDSLMLHLNQSLLSTGKHDSSASSLVRNATVALKKLASASKSFSVVCCTLGDNSDYAVNASAVSPGFLPCSEEMAYVAGSRQLIVRTSSAIDIRAFAPRESGLTHVLLPGTVLAIESSRKLGDTTLLRASTFL